MSSSSLAKQFEVLSEIEESMRLAYGYLLKVVTDSDVKNVITEIMAAEEHHRKLVEEALALLREYGD